MLWNWGGFARVRVRLIAVQNPVFTQTRAPHHSIGISPVINKINS